MANKCRKYARNITKNPNVTGRSALAQKEGFEPSHRLSQSTPLAGEPLRPLGYFCMWAGDMKAGGERGIRTPGAFGASLVFKTSAINRSAISPNTTSSIIIAQHNSSVKHEFGGILSAGKTFLKIEKIFDLGLDKYPGICYDYFCRRTNR